MLRNRTTTAVALGISFLLTACSSSQQLIQPSLTNKVSSNPQYLADLALKGPQRSMSLSSSRSCIDAAAIAADPAKGSSLRTKYAAMLRVMPEAIGNLALYRFIDEWYGVRYRLGGNSKDGIDCSAFIQKLYENVFGVNLLRTAMDQAGKSCLLPNLSECKEGDLIFFSIRSSRITHVGLYLMNNFFVHASSSQGIVISSLDDKYWSKHVRGAGRML